MSGYNATVVQIPFPSIIAYSQEFAVTERSSLWLGSAPNHTTGGYRYASGTWNWEIWATSCDLEGFGLRLLLDKGSISPFAKSFAQIRILQPSKSAPCR